jgi:hypothetical protein
MKKIIFTRPDGGVSVMGPCEGARLAFYIKLKDGKVIHHGFFKTLVEINKAGKGYPVDSFLRRWPVDVEFVEWAETAAEFYARIIAKDVPKDATNVTIIDESEIPTDRTFRNAWKAAPGRVEHDIPKCKELAHNMRREKRAAELAPLDDIIAKQIPGNNPQQVEAQRQVIRDKYAAIQTAIDAAQDVETIKAALGL